VPGTLVAILELWIAFSRIAFLRTGDPWVPVMSAVLGAILAMAGPGAWSIEARLSAGSASIFRNARGIFLRLKW
jgi:hypothetical protein